MWQIDTAITFFIGFVYANKEEAIEFIINKNKKVVFMIVFISFLITKFISMKFYTPLIDIIFVNIASIFLILMVTIILSII
ncbi:hypothetical protein [Clostridium sp. D53t1_180928_C8]|uniref:hypothetical protein n=1 Tax=Clostridium sp. D53t1_180928_C8 TaxID=2787101 RepID=UPI0018A8A948|nr:hypothetical protein [Clostridium sp. D53t1_180928_C8]